MTNVAIIVGGGVGKRFKRKIPKQFISVGGRPIIVHTTTGFDRCPSIDAIVVVVPEAWVAQCTTDLEACSCQKVLDVIAGGETRQMSCWQALQYLRDSSPDTVVIHDAVRPLVTEKMIETAISEGSKGMTFGFPAVDTLVECEDRKIVEVLPRQGIYHVQTPQSFPFHVLWDAHCKALETGITDASDDAGLVLMAGYTVKVVKGDPLNIKVTNPADVELVEHFLRQRRGCEDG